MGYNDDISKQDYVITAGGWFYQNTTWNDGTKPQYFDDLRVGTLTDQTISSVDGQHVEIQRDGSETGPKMHGLLSYTKGGSDPYYDISNNGLLHFPIDYGYFVKVEFEVQVPSASTYFIDVVGACLSQRGFKSTISSMAPIVGLRKNASGSAVGIYKKNSTDDGVTVITEDASFTVDPDTWYRVHAYMIHDIVNNTVQVVVRVNGKKYIDYTGTSLEMLDGYGAPSGVVTLCAVTNPSVTGTANKVRFRWVVVNRLDNLLACKVTRGLVDRPSKVEITVIDSLDVIPFWISDGTFVRVFHRRSDPPSGIDTSNDPSHDFIPVFSGYISRVSNSSGGGTSSTIQNAYEMTALGREAAIQERKVTVDATGGTKKALDVIDEIYYTFFDANKKPTNQNVRGELMDFKMKERSVVTVLSHLAAVDNALCYFDGLGEFYFGKLVTADVGEVWTYGVTAFKSASFNRSNPDYRNRIIIKGNNIEYSYIDSMGEGLPVKEYIIQDNNITTKAQARQRALAEAKKRRFVPVTGEIVLVMPKMSKQFDVGYLVQYTDSRYGWTRKPFIVHEFEMDLIANTVSVKLGPVDVSPYKAFKQMKDQQENLIGQNVTENPTNTYKTVELNTNVGVVGYIKAPELGLTSYQKCVVPDEFLEWLAKHFSYYDANAAKKTWVKNANDDKFKIVVHSDSTFFPRVTDTGKTYTDSTGFINVDTNGSINYTVSDVPMEVVVSYAQLVTAGTYYGVTAYWRNNPNVMGAGYTAGDPILAVACKLPQAVTLSSDTTVNFSIKISFHVLPSTFVEG